MEPDLLRLHRRLELDPDLPHRPLRTHPELGPRRAVLTRELHPHKPELARDMSELDRSSKDVSRDGSAETQWLLPPPPQVFVFAAITCGVWWSKVWEDAGLRAMRADVQRRVRRVGVDALVGGDGEGEGQRRVRDRWVEGAQGVGRDGG